MKRIFFVAILGLLMVGAASAQQRFAASLNGLQEVPANNSAGRGSCTIVLNAAETSITVNCTFSGLSSNANNGHIHGNAAVGVSAAVLFGFTGVPSATSGSIGPQVIAVTPTQVANMRAHLHYVNIHSVNFPGGEIRGQIKQVHTVYDRDGDGRTDITVFRQSNNTFYSLSSLTGAVDSLQFGSGAGDNWLNNTCDFDGDGRGDPLIIGIGTGNRATWSILQTGTNTLRNVVWGDFNAATGDTLAMADYDGDGKQDIAVYRRLTGIWNIIESSTGNARYIAWGANTGSATTGDQPCVGDYDGDGKADPTAVRTESGQRVFYTLRSSDGQSVVTIFGASATDGFFFFAPFDIDGDGKQDIAVNRTVGTQRTYFIKRSSDNTVQVITWGASGTGSTAMFGDYDGDGKTDIVARRTVAGQFEWYILRSSDGGTTIATFGITGDQ
ncbi:MAG: CHRD domain-containing protein [Pyrinomonadaceae bacterium]